MIWAIFTLFPYFFGPKSSHHHFFCLFGCMGVRGCLGGLGGFQAMRVIWTSWLKECQLQTSLKLYGVHPQLQENYTGVETARLWNWFFLPFLAETKREWLFPSQVYCKICPYSFQFALFWPKLLCFPVKSVVRGHERVGYERELLILLEKHSNLGQNNTNWKL